VAKTRRRAYTRNDIDKWTKQLTTRVETVSESLRDRTEKAVELIMAQADVYVPEDTMKTKNSAYVNVKMEKHRIVAEFGYDKDNDVDYISTIYYNVDNVTWRKAGARDMWLDEAFLETKEQAYQMIAGK
jgi:hypothetical protein